jgi:hypothetical protein
MPSCASCQSVFEIDDSERRFYQQISPTFAGKTFPVPDPTLCPLCRAQRRYIWRGELHLFNRKSDYSGKNILTFYPPGADCKVYERNVWWSDSWDSLEYGRDFDFSRPFFDQFHELIKDVPLIALSSQGDQENCDFINCASWNKNCYLIAGANYNEDCYYANYINHSNNCLDCNFIDHCELCYECIDCTGCYNTSYSQNSHGCSDSFFLFNCRNCQNCLGCVNLANKQYHFMNQALSGDAYREKLAEFQLFRRSKVEEARNYFEKHRLTFPHRFMIGDMNENVTGNGINNCRDTFHCFDVSDLWNCRYCSWFHKAKDCMDVHAWGFPAELCYECMEVGDNTYHVLFSVSCYGAQEVLYSYYATYCRNCFGCVGIRRKDYCIFNKSYSPSEYERQVGKIINHMQETGEWGEFFPITSSPLCYNTAITQDYFPIAKEDADAFGWKWYDFPKPEATDSGSVEIPDNIDEVDESICSVTLTCSESGQAFKIIKPELSFYKKNRIPLPEKSFFTRHEHRLQRRNPRQLWERECAKCKALISTSYPPYRPEIVYCEKCYLSEVY